MSDVDAWDAYFEPDRILRKLALTSECGDLVEFGCGYGTFTIPAMRLVSGKVYALDIDAEMIAIAARRAEETGQSNVEFLLRDFVAHGTGLADGSMDYAMLFNILHHDEPVALLSEAYRNLIDGGLLGVIHWNYDPDTPRGPPMDIRPRPNEIVGWAEDAGFQTRSDVIDLPPYHYGLVFCRDAM